MPYVIIAAIALYAYVALGRRNGYWPFAGRVGAAGAMVWYEADNALQIPHVQGAWDRRIAAMETEGRLFTVPGRGGCTTWDHLDTWRPFTKGLSTRAHLLRIVHNHWRHDMDNDAIALEFASAGDLSTFLSRVPSDGPEPFVFADHLGVEGRAQLTELLARNRMRTEMEAA